jgi:hypothetical protein
MAALHFQMSDEKLMPFLDHRFPHADEELMAEEVCNFLDADRRTARPVFHPRAGLPGSC